MELALCQLSFPVLRSVAVDWVRGDSRKYSSNVLVLEYSFNSTSGQKIQFPVPVFQINKQLLELYANLAPSPSSCDLRVASFAT